MSSPQLLFPKPAARVFVLLVALWAVIYLPGLGKPELKGEEGRRILPAITMLETGNWLVPYIAGEPFLRKPPLVNWLIAGSFKLTGLRNEFAARLPSILAMLALAAALVALGTGGEWMNTETALTAALLTLTPLSALEKGRLAEIEGVYVALSGIAMVSWLAFWTQRRSPWLLWVAPFFFLGLGLLAKAPLHLLFFYAIVLGVLGSAREWRLLWHPAHFAGLALAAAIWAAWAVPYFRHEATTGALGIWQAQSVGRVTGGFDFAGWLGNIPRALSDQLPWLLFVPLLWRADLPQLGERAHAMFRGARLGVLIAFFGLLLVPGSLPRYTMPLLAPFACLLAVALADHRLAPPATALRAWWRANSILALVLAAAACVSLIAPALFIRFGIIAGEAVVPEPGYYTRDFIVWPLVAAAGALTLALAVWFGRRRLARPVLMAVGSAMLIGAGMLIYSAAVMPFLLRRDKLRPMAFEIEQTADASARLCVYDADIQPVLFYLQRPFFYAPVMEQIPTGHPWVFTREEKRKKLLRDRPEYEVVRGWPAEKPQVILLKLKSQS